MADLDAITTAVGRLFARADLARHEGARSTARELRTAAYELADAHGLGELFDRLCGPRTRLFVCETCAAQANGDAIDGPDGWTLIDPWPGVTAVPNDVWTCSAACLRAYQSTGPHRPRRWWTSASE